MRITIVGPRSVGKSTVSKELAKKLNYKYHESDFLMNKALETFGGLNKVIKTKNYEKLSNEVPKVMALTLSKNNIVLDLAGGSISTKNKNLIKARNLIRKLVKKNTIILGLLPCKNKSESISFLFEREKNRAHFKEEDPGELKSKVKKDYIKIIPILKKMSKRIFYTKDKTPSKIVNEIISFLKTLLEFPNTKPYK